MSVATATHTFLTDCVSCPGPNAGEDINEMKDNAEDISREDFLFSVNSEELQEIARSLGYDETEDGFNMENDWHISYSKGTFQGSPCVFFTWSAIEYIFTA